jgi:hypothetical protein
MSQDGRKTFIQEWLKKAKQEKPDSVIVRAIRSATGRDQLNEVELLRLLREEAKPVEERKKP